MDSAVQKRRPSGQVLTLVPPLPESQASAPKKRGRFGFYLKLGLALMVVVGALVATGYVVYEQAQQKAVTKELRRARQMAALDTPVAYRVALGILDELEKKRPRDARLAEMSAEIWAFLWGRFGGDEQARTRATNALARAQKLKADPELLAAVEGYHLLYKGRYADAARHAEAALLTHKKSARLGYVLGVARYHLGDLTAAEATFKLAVAHDGRFLPARVALGRLQRLRGYWKSAEATLSQVITDSPKHLEALLERWQVQHAIGRDKADEVALAQLQRQAQAHPPLSAVAKLAAARYALQLGEWERARKLLQESALLAPDDPEIALQSADAQLLPGGDAHKAWTNQERVRERCREFRTAAAVLAQTALAVGQPDQALRFLRRPIPAEVPPAVRERIVVTRVNAAHELDQPEVADRICGEVLKRAKPGPRARVACLLHAARRRQADVLRAEAKRVSGPTSELVAGLRDYRAYRYFRAVNKLTAAVRAQDVEPWVLVLLAESLQALERPIAALPLLRRAVRESAEDHRMRLELARGLLAARRGGEALRLFETLVKEKPSGARTLYDLGTLGLALRQPKAVAEIAKRLLRLHPSSGHGPYLEGALLLAAEQRRKAQLRFETALMREPNHVASKVALARLAFWRGDTGGGRVLYESAWKAAGGAPDILVELARSYFKHKRINRARKAFVRATLQYRGLGALYLASGVMSELAERLGSLKKYRRQAILRILGWSLKLFWSNPRSHLRMAKFQEARGYHFDARLGYQRATRYGPEISEGYYYLGAHLLAWKRELGQAERALVRFLEMEGPRGGRRVSNARKWLARIKARRKYFERRK